MLSEINYKIVVGVIFYLFAIIFFCCDSFWRLSCVVVH